MTRPAAVPGACFGRISRQGTFLQFVNAIVLFEFKVLYRSKPRKAKISVRCFVFALQYCTHDFFSRNTLQI